MTTSDLQQLRSLGIIGGVGPLASAEFLKTIYEQGKAVPEQQMPKVFMCSDPGFPDRSELGRSGEEICIRLQKGLHDLNSLNVSGVVICCVTMHQLLPKLPTDQRKNIISLVDIIFEKLAQLSLPHIVLCSTQTNKVRLFQQHPCWPAVRQFLILPDDEDQRQVQDLIFHLKRNGSPNSARSLLDRFAEKYGARHFICGCTEMHLLAKRFKSSSELEPRYTFLDPLMVIAKSLTHDQRNGLLPPAKAPAMRHA